MRSTALIPRILDAFSVAIRPFDCTTPTDEQVQGAIACIRHYTGQVQAADLSLSQREAAMLLQRRLIADRAAR